jgi:alkyl sulfatase BDS1-like metallo-beta-lactamase superfamily hydrolase
VFIVALLVLWIVDCMESDETAKAVMAQFRKLCKKPVAAIIYTHNHSDHVQGTKSFMEYAVGKKCDVYSHAKTETIMKTFMTKTGAIGFKRAGRQFGQFLPANQHINCGIGPCLAYSQDTLLDLVLPSITFSTRLDVTIAGVRLELHHAPGETDDQIVVYVPEKSVLCAADNIYKSFPNLYAIRGTPTRDAHQWATTIEFMRTFQVEHLVPSHTRPVDGAQTVNDLLINYRDAILFVHDQTVRYMNQGMFIDDIVPRVSLPPHLIKHPHLQEYYGTVAWSVRGVFNQYIGWFGGDPAYLRPHSPPEHAMRMVKLAGGVSNLTSAAQDALNAGDPQWALLCSQSIMRHRVAEIGDGTSSVLPEDPDFEAARSLAVAALEKLAEAQVSANGRNYYLTYALELAGKLSLAPSATQVKGATRAIGAIEVLRMLSCRVIPANCLHVERERVLYRFPDLRRALGIEVSRGVARTYDCSASIYASDEAATTPAFTVEDFDIVVTVDSNIFLEVAAKDRSSAGAILSGDMQVTGKGLTSSMTLKKFMDYFEDSASSTVVPI